MERRKGDLNVYDTMRDPFNKGYVQVYTGDGKGKTTASLGLIVRALGAGLSVYLGQFIKAGRYSEIECLESLVSARLTCKQYGKGCFIFREASDEDRVAAREGLVEARAALRSGEYQVVVLDEINVACSLELITVDDILDLIDERPQGVELILTGRHADEAVMKRADLVTEMREIKHYYKEGVLARKGIES